MNKFIFTLVAVAFSIVKSDYPTWQGCADLSNNDFREVEVINTTVDPSISEPLKMAFDMDAQFNVDIYFVERKGAVKKYTASSGNVTTLGDLDVFEQHEQGLFGIALDPNFKTNKHMYLLYSPTTSSTFRLSRFTLDGSGNLDISSEVNMIDIPNNRNTCCHTGGGMQFDAYGDLWATIGNNSANGGGSFINETEKHRSDEWGASSTAGMRGGIIRIHPEANGTYTIPKDNFGEYFAKYWRQQGNNAVAAEYEDPNKVFPEIWLKGTRNAFSLTIDPVRRWAMYGDVGPDFGGLTDEFSLYTHPAFAGWPYWAGDNVINTHINQNERKTDPTNPINTSQWNTGVNQLPPAEPAILPEQQGCAITGPLYRYDGDLQTTVKMPPHFQRHWFLTEFNRNFTKAVKVADDGLSIEGNPSNNVANDSKFDVFTHIGKHRPLDFQAGPDGALYILNYDGWFNTGANTGISRIEYTGNCLPTEPKLEQPVVPIRPLVKDVLPKSDLKVFLKGSNGYTLPQGVFGVAFYNIQGTKVWQFKRTEASNEFKLDFPTELQQKILRIQIFK